MLVKQFRQQHFRNLTTTAWRPPEGIVAIMGHNAQGKTNLLHAISLVLGGHTRGNNHDNIAFGQAQAGVWAQIETQFGGTELECNIGPQGKQHKLGQQSSKHKQLEELPGCVLIEPDDLDLVLGTPDGRRDFLDILLMRFSARYRAVLSQYQKNLQQRNALLKMARKSGSALEQIPIWNQGLVACGNEIIAMRQRILDKLNPLASQMYGVLSQSSKTLECTIEHTATAEDFLQRLEQRTPEDIQRGYTTVGPHRDDIQLLLDQKPAARFGSRGECRSIALALKLAEHQLLWKHHQEPPILLIDEWHNELDQHRRAALLHYAQTLPQSFIAGLEVPEGAQIQQFWVRGGAWL